LFVTGCAWRCRQQNVIYDLPMALIFDQSECAICGELLGKPARIVATTHFIGDPRDPLWRFSDAAMHYECFQKWPDREEFIRKYNSTVGQMVWGNSTRHIMRPDGIIEVIPTRE